MITFLLGLLLIPTLIVIATPRPTYAEGLLYKVGCVVKVLLDANCTNTKTTSPAPAQTTAPPSSTTAAPTPSQSGASSTTQAPITTNPSPTAALPDMTGLVAPPQLAPDSHTPSVAYALPQIRATASPSPTGAAAQVAMALEPTDQGWRILGVLWYWWLLPAAALTAGGIMLKRVLMPKSSFT